jgi:hypothetical protein
MPFLSPCDCRTALQQPDFWKRLDQAPSGEPSARKAKAGKNSIARGI